MKHVEFAERFDVSEDLELDSIDDSFVEQFNLDIFGFGLLFLAAFSFLVYRLSMFLFRYAVLVSRLFNSYLLISRTKKVN